MEMQNPVNLFQRLDSMQSSVPTVMLSEMQRAVTASLHPQGVAKGVACCFSRWLPSVSWCVVKTGESGSINVFSGHRCVEKNKRVIRFVLSNLQRAPFIHDILDSSVVAVPLSCRGRTNAVLVGIDRDKETRVSQIATLKTHLLASLLEPASYALDNAFLLQRAVKLSETDGLTELYNSRYLILRIQKEFKRALKMQQALSLLFIDLDNFKEVNSQYGHMFGNRLIIEVVQIIRHCSTDNGISARFGGDEFVVLLTDTDKEAAFSIANSIKDSIGQLRFLSLEGFHLQLTASIGVASMSRTYETGTELLWAADSAMSLVKACGKDGVQFARQASEDVALSREEQTV